MPVFQKSSVSFSFIAPGGFEILSAITQASRALDCDLIITSGCDGIHSGPGDPHHSGNAFDIRSHDFSTEQKDRVLAQIMNVLGWERFYGFLEDAGTDNEHFHFQVKKGTVYP